MQAKSNKADYNYRVFLERENLSEQFILDKYDYPDVCLKNRIKTNIGKLSSDDINAIVLWKLNRQVDIKNIILQELSLCSKITNPKEVLYDGEYFKDVNELLRKLLKSKGIQLPMASTILHFCNENVFPIIDHRAYRTVFNFDDSTRKLEYKEKRKIDDKIDLYINYIKECLKFYDEHIDKTKMPFSKIDKYLYELDIMIGNQVSYKKEK